ncbi:methyltransferase domain-containing protein [Haloarchaeobius baliensis]|uniref:methyltransferase domain-containing protein n=1 Tax=Haloarchaeobius baliensis TaxID=1670458 RepID=UPI003F881B7A
MRRFDAEYLEHTRSGMWADSRAALDPLELGSADSVLDVGCGTGEFSRVLAEETDGQVVGCDADPELLAVAGEFVPVVAGDATRLPFRDGAFDVVTCQALLVNLPDPAVAVEEFARVAADRVAVVEPDNAAVTVDSTVEREAGLARAARAAYIAGSDVDPALGSDAAGLLREAGLVDVEMRRYEHTRTVAPPYDEADLQAVAKKASGAGLASDEASLRATLSDAEYDDLRESWREMGREAAAQAADGDYRRVETVPFYVTTGRVGDGD